MDAITPTKDQAASTGLAAKALFEVGEPLPPPVATVGGSPRLRYANRSQIEMRVCALDSLIPEEHPVRTVWAYVQELDLTELLAKIKAVEGRSGASATDPRILLTLWLYATLRGVGSARELDRRRDPDTGEVPFQWICGGVTLNYHTLADFRVGHTQVLDNLLTDSVAVLLEQDLVSMERVAQDGMKVRASAGQPRFDAVRGWSSSGRRLWLKSRPSKRRWTATRRRPRVGNRRRVSGPPKIVRRVCVRPWSSCRRSRPASRPRSRTTPACQPLIRKRG